MRFLWSTGSHQGRVRDNNEDSVYPTSAGKTEGPLLVAVADGMGGHVGGEIASAIAIEHATVLAGEEATPQERVVAGNEAIMDAVLEDPHLAGMGTTMTLALLEPLGRVTIGHVGDTRAYLLREDELRRLTDDHSVVEMYLAAGRITEDEAKRHPQRGMLTRALGLGRDLEVDVRRERLRAGDRFMLCSDGLSSMVDDDRICELLIDGTPEEAVWTLIDAANLAGGFDNVTLVVVDYLP
ncbi:MAG: protein phosphatase 2C domain-containing protein [Acidimicrobiia bacterium]|nr:protein phosphatase 2C domain-containing protein [Acidimicrobiia bacterium]